MPRISSPDTTYYYLQATERHNRALEGETGRAMIDHWITERMLKCHSCIPYALYATL